MNITFLIGNGFDLNLGLKTSFSDFLKVYKEPQENDSNAIKEFKNHILEDEELWSDAELAFGKYTEVFDGMNRTDKDFSDCHQDFCIKLGEYLESEEDKLAFIHSDTYIAFANSLPEISLGLGKEPAATLFARMNTYGVFNVYNFISFNYTHVIDSFFNEAKKIPVIGRNSAVNNRVGKLLHVHGYTNDEMMLGVNDESQIKNAGFFKEELYKHQIIKPVFNELNETGMDGAAYKLISESELLYVYGMSLGQTDKVWWERILELLVLNKDLRVIIYVHKNFNNDLFKIYFT